MALSPNALASEDALSVTDTVSLAQAEEMAANAAKKAVEAVLASLPQDGGGANVQDVISRLALAIGGLTAQNSGKVYTDPEVIEKRKKAHLRMLGLIEKCREDGTPPRYKLVNIVVFDDTCILPTVIDAFRRQVPQEIDWYSAPNEALRPMNAEAEAIFQAFTDSIRESPMPHAQNPTISPNGLRLKYGDPVQEEIKPAVPPSAGGLVLHQRNAGRQLEEVRMLGKTAPPAVRQVA